MAILCNACPSTDACKYTMGFTTNKFLSVIELVVREVKAILRISVPEQDQCVPKSFRSQYFVG